MTAQQGLAASGRVLSSDWTGLSHHLLARFYAVKGEWAGDKRVYNRVDDIEVHAPLIESNLDVTLNWQSPFESMSPDQARPALTAMLQSGAIQPVLNAVGGGVKEGTAKPTLTQQVGNFSEQFEGRTGITKLNSTQVFSGMPPAKITVQAMFRAWKDPQSEVDAPFAQLLQWALPKSLAADGTLVNLANAKSPNDAVLALMPSEAPVMIAMEYKRRRFLPLVIESIGEPLNSPINRAGLYTELVVPMTLATLTAIDRADMTSFTVNGADATVRVR